jgi:hypothetical protein
MNWREEQQKWIEPIGRLMIAFGRMEYSLRVCLLHLKDHQHWNNFKNKEFKAKASGSIKVLESVSEIHPPAQRAISLLNDAIRLAKYRNLIAHNPLSLDMFEDQSGDYKTRTAIRSLRDNETTIDYETLLDVVEAAELIEDELYVYTQHLWDKH